MSLGSLIGSLAKPSAERPADQWYARAMEQLIETVQELSMAHDLAAVMAIVRRAARDLTGADGAAFVLKDGDYCYYADENAMTPLWKGRRFEQKICISGWVMQHRESVVIEDIFADPRIPADVYRPTFVRSLAMVPIRTRDPVGAIGNYWATRRRPSPEQVKILQALADTTAVALENVRIYSELEKKVNDLDALMTAAPVAILSLDLQGRPRQWNAATERLFQRPPLDAFDGDLPSIHRDSRDTYRRVLDSVRDAKNVDGVPLQMLQPSGTMLDVRVWGAPILTGEGVANTTVRAILLVIQDETERKRFERQFLQAQKMEAVGQLTGGIAHDFNNLLGVLVGNLDLIHDRVTNDAETVELVEAAVTAVSHGTDLNKRLLAFSRRQTLEPQAIDPNASITGMVKLLRRTLGERVDVRLACGDGVWQVKVDPAQLETAVINLCVNARDAMAKGGILTIETSNISIDAYYAGDHDELTEGDYVMIAVSDNGDGMSPEVLKHVFEPFFTTKPVGHGTGLGLPMVYGFMKQSKGHVNIYSEPGRGTTVRLYLPRLDGVPVHAGQGSPVAPVDYTKGGELVLLVEDNPDVRQIVSRLVESLGYRIVETVNADQALELIDKGLLPDVLFADVSMPGRMDGIDLANALRGRFPDLPILLTSGFTERASPDMRKRDEEYDFAMLSKPYRRDQLAQALRAVLDESGWRAGAA